MRSQTLLLCCFVAAASWTTHRLGAEAAGSLRQASGEVSVDDAAQQSSDRSADEKKTPTLLVPSQPELDFGIRRAGGRYLATVSLHNPTATAVEVGQVWTSCGCFRLELNQKAVGPGERIVAEVTVDLTDDPTFTGLLRFQATGIDEQGAVAFVVHACAQVVSGEVNGG